MPRNKFYNSEADKSRRNNKSSLKRSRKKEQRKRKTDFNRYVRQLNAGEITKEEFLLMVERGKMKDLLEASLSHGHLSDKR